MLYITTCAHNKIWIRLRMRTRTWLYFSLFVCRSIASLIYPQNAKETLCWDGVDAQDDQSVWWARMLYNAQHRKTALILFANSESRCACAYMQSALDSLCLSTYTTVSIDFVSGQRRPRSACANAQAYQGLRCPQIVSGPFSCVLHHVVHSLSLWLIFAL